MLQFLETGKALYVLAAVCILGMLSKWITRNLYKSLIKETDNMTLTKNKSLRTFKQKTESTYRMNQGISNVQPYLERQMYDFKFFGASLGGWGNFSNQMTLLCFLLGGAAAFMAYWFRCDSYYIVLYGSIGILAGLLTILADNGAGLSDKKQQLFVSLQNYLENTMFSRLAKEQVRDSAPMDDSMVPMQSGLRESVKTERTTSERNPMERSAAVTSRKRIGKAAQTAQAAPKEPEAAPCEPAARRDIDYLKHSLEQIAVSREAARTAPSSEENWLKDLDPNEVKLISEIIREYLS